MEFLEELKFVCDTAHSSTSDSTGITFENDYAEIRVFQNEPLKWTVDFKITDRNQRTVTLFKKMINEMDDNKFIEKCEKVSPAFLNYLDELLNAPTDYVIFLINEFLKK